MARKRVLETKRACEYRRGQFPFPFETKTEIETRLCFVEKGTYAIRVIHVHLSVCEIFTC